VVDEILDGGIRYTEKHMDHKRGPCRQCALHLSEVKDPVSVLNLFSFSYRFGGTALPVEGVGDVKTDPEHRRKGYLSRLMDRAMTGAAERVDALFLFGITGFYTRFGFTSCLADSRMTLWLRNAKALDRGRVDPEPLSPADLPEFLDFFNRLNSRRPFTRVRDDRVALALFKQPAWNAAPECIALRRDGRITAYAVLEGYGFGWMLKSFNVLETGALTREDAEAMIAVLRDRSLDRGVDTISFHEPVDSVFGRTLRLYGAEFHSKSIIDGGGMGCILNRENFVNGLEDELGSRNGGLIPCGTLLSGLAKGTIIEDRGNLLRLLLGYWSWEDAVHAGVSAPKEYHDLFRRIFPGGGTANLQAPMAHNLDGY
jgi:GNAT superfamily N-acetyltransferase